MYYNENASSNSFSPTFKPIMICLLYALVPVKYSNYSFQEEICTYIKYIYLKFSNHYKSNLKHRILIFFPVTCIM